jgi:hypothetical protein
LFDTYRRIIKARGSFRAFVLSRFRDSFVWAAQRARKKSPTTGKIAFQQAGFDRIPFRALLAGNGCDEYG